MQLWTHWWSVLWQLRPACSRLRSFLWFAVCVAGMTVRTDLLGVTSTVRALGLRKTCYDRLLDSFHSSAIRLDAMTRLWVRIVLRSFPGALRVGGRLVLVADGIKIPKRGRKMPGVKLLHQESDSNTKPEFIMGHSFQAVALLVATTGSAFAVPLASRIHEGVVESNRDQRTLLDKMVLLLDSLQIEEPFYFVADAYYASGKVIHGLLGRGDHLVTRARCLDLLWKPVGIAVRFVLVDHPTRGRCILMSSDVTLDPIEIVRLYGLRFKIELSFKQAVRTVGAYAYHFWMREMKPRRRRSGNQYLHRESRRYRDGVHRKLDAYHRFVHAGIVAQGLLQYLSCAFPGLVWSSFGSWLRTIRPGIPPSEMVCAVALANTLPNFLVAAADSAILAKFIGERLDTERYEGIRLTG